MSDPVVLPSSRVVVDRSTAERLLLSSAAPSDPFSRAPLDADQPLEADEGLARRIEEWRRGQEEAMSMMME